MKFKSITLVLPLLMLTACSNRYPSMRQAKDACEAWADKGKTVTVKYDWFSNGNIERISVHTRNCEVEEETKQVLGFRSDYLESGDYRRDQPLDRPRKGMEVEKNYYF